jgi:hypothetical protein
MKRKAVVLISLSIMLSMTGLTLMAQQNKADVSVFVESQEDFLEDYAGETIFHFHLLYDDRYTNHKEIREMAETLPEVVKFGIRNSPDEKTGRYLCYLKTSSQKPHDTFNQFLKKFSVEKISLEGKKVSVKKFKQEINNLK